MEGVRVLHDELAPAHQPEARPDLVTELGLDLVEVDRQLLVAVQLVAAQVGDHFLVGRAHAELAVVAILQAQQLGPVLDPAAGFLPELGRLDGRHQHFQRAGLVHLVAHDRLGLAQHPQAHRQPGVQAGSELADHPGAQHQLVADDNRIGGRFFQGREQVLTGAHGGRLRACRRGWPGIVRRGGRRVQKCPAASQANDRITKAENKKPGTRPGSTSKYAVRCITGCSADIRRTREFRSGRGCRSPASRGWSDRWSCAV